jgi:hypothetical protein
MKAAEVAVATMTLARDPEEEVELSEALDALERVGLPVFVTDGGSSRGFADTLRERKNFTACKTQQRGLWGQIRESLFAAASSGARFVLYTEPDKHAFFEHDLAALLEESPHGADLGIVLASRSPEHFATFPPFQQYTESVINRCCAEVLGHPFDYSYGPFLLNALMVEGLYPCEHTLGWGWRQYAFSQAHQLGLRIEQLPRGGACPAGQREDDARVYRMQQMVESVRGLVLAAQTRVNGPAPAGSSR